MGLDMLLFKRNKESEDTDDMIEIGYWRKANHIHNWFVQNCQGGVDDCNYYEVTKTKLESLLADCKKVLDPTGSTVPLILRDRIAESVLPTVQGFFFGSTDYDDGYYEDIKDTIEILERVLVETDFENEVIIYSSSW